MVGQDADVQDESNFAAMIGGDLTKHEDNNPSRILRTSSRVTFGTDGAVIKHPPKQKPLL
jgi:hypothetical protein